MPTQMAGGQQTKAERVSRRRRVPFEGDVVIEEPRRRRRIRAQARNLSESGIAITADSVLVPGSEVECRLLIGGERRRLRGRVAWARGQGADERPRSAGAGIEFVSLDEEDHQLLSRVIDGADDSPRTAELWVDGVEHPLKVRALVGTHELKVGLRLPRLQAGAQVRLRFLHRGVMEERTGTIAELKFLPGDERTAACVVAQVATPRPAFGQGTIETAAGGSEASAGGELPGGPVPSVLVDASALAIDPVLLGAGETGGVVGANVESDADVTVVTRAPRSAVAPSARPAVLRTGFRGGALVAATALALLAGMGAGTLLTRSARPQAMVSDEVAGSAARATVTAPARPEVTIVPLTRTPADDGQKRERSAREMRAR